jgi:hypothetical protein
MMLPSNRRQCNTLDHREVMSMPFRLSACCSILLNPRNLLRVFPAICFSEKGPHGFRRRSKSGRKRPWGRAATAGVAVAYLILQIQRPCALTRLNFPSTLFCVAAVRIAAGHVGGTRPPCPRRNAPITLIAQQNDIVPSPAALSRAVILRSKMMPVKALTSPST